MTHSSNADRTAFDEAFERYIGNKSDSRTAGDLFAAAQRVKGSKDLLPGWIVEEVEAFTTEGQHQPVTYGAAALIFTSLLKGAGLLPATEMTPAEIKAARHSLGLTQSELAVMLDTDAQTVRRMELDPTASTFRKPAPRMVRLIRAYLDGYRPTDWIE